MSEPSTEPSSDPGDEPSSHSTGERPRPDDPVEVPPLPDEPPDDPAQRRRPSLAPSAEAAARAGAAAALADELRAAVVELATTEVPDEGLAEALADVRALRSRLRGERRPRWYEAGDLGSMDQGAKDSFHLQSPLRGRLNVVAPPLAVDYTERDDGTPVVRATARLSRAYEGPPHGVHGGFVAAMFDEVLGATQALAGAPGVTGRLTVHFRHLTPIEEDLAFEGWIERSEGRRVVAKATCHAGETLCADADGLFFRVDFTEIEARMANRPRTT